MIVLPAPGRRGTPHGLDRLRQTGGETEPEKAVVGTVGEEDVPTRVEHQDCEPSAPEKPRRTALRQGLGVDDLPSINHPPHSQEDAIDEPEAA